MPPALEIIRQSAFTPKPWKNGAGVTHEAIRVPAVGETFAWRVSVAHIDASGPFSNFAGYGRRMVLLKGDGVELKFSDGSQRSLRRIGDLVEFDGGLAAQCTLLGGPCVDLNLMVAKSRPAAAEVKWLTESQGSLEASAAPGQSTLIFSIDDSVAVTAHGAAAVRLNPWDLAVLGNGSARVARLQARASSIPSGVFFATMSH